MEFKEIIVLIVIAIVISILIGLSRRGPRELSKPRLEDEPKPPLSIVWTKIAEVWEATTKGVGKMTGGKGEKGEKKPHLLTYPIVFLVVYWGIGWYWMKSNPDLHGPWARDWWLFWIFIPAVTLIAAWVTTLKKSLLNFIAILFLGILLNDARIAYAKTEWWKDKQAWIVKQIEDEKRSSTNYVSLRTPEVRIAPAGNPEHECDWTAKPVQIDGGEYFKINPAECVYVRINGRSWYKFYPTDKINWGEHVYKLEFMSATINPVKVTVEFITREEAMKE